MQEYNFLQKTISQISFSSNFFGLEQFKSTITVNLTCLLVNVTLFNSVEAKLPTSSYFKLIDSWLLVTMSIPFFEVVLHTIMLYYKQKQDNFALVPKEIIETIEKKQILIQKCTIFVLPICFTLFFLAFTGYGIINSFIT